MIDELFEYVEGLEFASRTNLANDFRTFVRALELDDTQERLCAVASFGENGQRILERVQSLTSVQSDLNYENPSDSALATYLRVLYFTNSPLTFHAAKIVADAPRLWWAEFVATLILRNQSAISLSARVASSSIGLQQERILYGGEFEGGVQSASHSVQSSVDLKMLAPQNR